MKIDVIKCSDLDDYLKFAELKQDLVTRLTILKDIKEIELEHSKQLKSIAERLAILKQRLHLKLDVDLRKEINKRITGSGFGYV
jgi:hypothetical protein